MSCPDCHEAAKFVSYRPKTFVSLLGEIRLERAYYHCPHCHAGFVPWDQVLRLSADALTPGAREVAGLAGILSSFAEGSVAALPKLTGLRLSESTVERTTEAAGRDVGARLARGEVFGPACDWDWHKDAEGKTCAYVSRDATGVCQQGPDGAKAEGRMVAVAMVYNPVPEVKERRACPDKPAPRFNVRYVAGLDGIASLGEPLRRQAAQVGMDRADRWIAISDGGSGLEDWLRTNFGRVDAVILDFYHACEYLGTLGRAIHPDDEALREAWLGDWCHRLKHEGGLAVLEGLRGLEVRGRGARDALADVTRYFENQSHRMDYPGYVAKAWAIGSGPVESACKTVVGQRMKGAGMRWGADGADSVSHLTRTGEHTGLVPADGAEGRPVPVRAGHGGGPAVPGPARIEAFGAGRVARQGRRNVLGCPDLRAPLALAGMGFSTGGRGRDRGSTTRVTPQTAVLRLGTGGVGPSFLHQSS